MTPTTTTQKITGSTQATNNADLIHRAFLEVCSSIVNVTQVTFNSDLHWTFSDDNNSVPCFDDYPDIDVSPLEDAAASIIEPQATFIFHDYDGLAEHNNMVFVKVADGWSLAPKEGGGNREADYPTKKAAWQAMAPCYGIGA